MHQDIADRIAREQHDPEAREAALFARLAEFLPRAAKQAPGLAKHLDGHDLTSITTRAALAALPVLRKDDLMVAQRNDPPFGGFATGLDGAGTRFFMSPGPVFEPQPHGIDPWRATSALHAAGIGAGDIVLNCFSYHLTPGAWILDEAARALGAHVIPGGVGNTAQQVAVAAALGATAYVGTPDFLKSLLDAADGTDHDLSRMTKALVSGGALFPEMRAHYRASGLAVLQCYATADCGVIAYEEVGADGAPVPGLVVSEEIIVEIVRPGTDTPVEDGEVGEIVVTTFNPAYPLVRFGTGDMSKRIDLPSPNGRTNARLAGWMGRADQRTKVKGMFVDPKQIAEIVRTHPEIAKARLVVGRTNDHDDMVLKVEAERAEAASIAVTLKDVTKMTGAVDIVPPGSLPNDGKVIEDTRDYDA